MRRGSRPEARAMSAMHTDTAAGYTGTLPRGSRPFQELLDRLRGDVGFRAAF